MLYWLLLLLRALVSTGGTVTDDQFMELAQLSRESVHMEFKKVENIGMVEVWDKPTNGRSLRVVKLKSEFEWYLSENFTKFFN